MYSSQVPTPAQGAPKELGEFEACFVRLHMIMRWVSEGPAAQKE